MTIKLLELKIHPKLSLKPNNRTFHQKGLDHTGQFIPPNCDPNCRKIGIPTKVDPLTDKMETSTEVQLEWRSLIIINTGLYQMVMANIT